jgi:hypothetical protein
VVFEKVHEARALLHFVRERLPRYTPLVAGEMQRFRLEIVRATVGAGVAAVAGVIFLSFLSVAAIVSAWGGSHRIAIAWLICGIWGLIALAGLWAARKAVRMPPPFHLVGTALVRDYEQLLDSLGEASGASGR